MTPEAKIKARSSRTSPSGGVWRGVLAACSPPSPVMSTLLPYGWLDPGKGTAPSVRYRPFPSGPQAGKAEATHPESQSGRPSQESVGERHQVRAGPRKLNSPPFALVLR